MNTRPGLWRMVGSTLMATAASGCMEARAPDGGAVTRAALEVPAECADVALPGPLRALEEDVWQVRMGACGDLSVTRFDYTGAYWDGALATRTAVQDVTALVLSTTSRRLGAFTGGGAVGIDIDSHTTEAVPAADLDIAFGFVWRDGATSAWGCAGGALRVDDQVLMDGVDCAAVSAHEASGRLLATDATSRELSVIDATTGERHATGVTYGVEVPGEMTYSAMRWSADGSVALVEDVRFQDCGDWMCMAGGSATVAIEAATGRPIGLLGGALERWMGTPDRRQMVRLDAHAGTAAGMDGAGTTLFYVRADRTLGEIADARTPFAVSGDGAFVFAAVGVDAELVRASTSGGEDRTGVRNVETLAVSARGDIAAGGHVRDDFMGWRLTRWSPTEGAVVLADAAQPVTVHWVGDDGAVLASALFGEGLEGPWRTVLFAPDGSERARWDGTVSTVTAVEDTLFMQHGDGILRVDSGTGRNTVVTTGRLEAVHTDAARVRVALVIERDGGMDVWAGARAAE